MANDSAPTLEDAVIRLWGYRNKEGHGFKEEDQELAEALTNKWVTKGAFSEQEYRDAYKMLDCDYYKNQLKEREIYLELIPREPPQTSNVSEKPSIRSVDLKTDPVGTIGVNRDTWEVVKVMQTNSDDNVPKKYLKWISDCAVHIHTETRSCTVNTDSETKAEGETEFTFVGGGAIDKRPVKFTMRASDLAQPYKFKAALLNAFGAENKIGTLNFEMVQEMSDNIRHLKRVEVPVWDGAIPLVPGVDLAKDVEFRLYKSTPAEVYDGDIKVAKESMRNLLGLHKYAPILVTAILGSPVVARWHPNDRFGLALWGGTGSRKTSTMLAALSIFGVGYAEKDRMLKSDAASSTEVACGEIAAGSGMMPQTYDNVKTVDYKQLNKYVGFIHSVLEGGEKPKR